MKQIKKMLRVSGIIILIVLACFGIGIIGGAIIPSVRKREYAIEITTEIKKTDESKSELINIFE